MVVYGFFALAVVACEGDIEHDRARQSPPPRPVAFVRRYAAERLGMSPSEVEIVEMEKVVWPDGCLGVPAPELCQRVRTPGYRVTLRAGGHEYRYHTDTIEGFAFAGPGAPPGPQTELERSRP